ncbi:MAG: OmpA family protein [Bacteroidia bacterium]|nr:OmpA family protein [Bacteroidia bacterium]
MKKYLLFLIAGFVLAIPAALFSQKGFFKFFLHFETGKSDLVSKEKKTLDKMLDTLRKNSIVKIVYIKGYTDNVGDEEVNQKLSQSRSVAVKTHLVRKKIPATIIVVKNYGEEMPVADNETDEGKQKNRRVEIIVSWQRKQDAQNLAKKNQKEKNADENNDSNNPCARDTVITLSRGTQISMNICEWRRKKDCISVDEFTDMQSLLGSDMNTMTSKGKPMITGGMFRLRLCDDSCLRKPITIRRPVNDSCLGDAKLSLWNMTIGNRWGEDKTNRGLRIVRIDGKKYYEFDVFCPGGKNLDVKIENYIDQNKRFKFTINKRKYKLIDVRMTYQCPDAVITSNNKRPRKTLFIKGFCPDNEPFITATAINKKGDTLEMDYRPISSLSHNVEPCNCDKSRLVLKKENAKPEKSSGKEEKSVSEKSTKRKNKKERKSRKDKKNKDKKENEKGFKLYKNYKLDIKDFERKRRGAIAGA